MSGLGEVANSKSNNET